MEKGPEFFDAWVKSQKEFLENWSRSQEAFMANYTESMKTLQESLKNIEGSQEGPMKEMLNQFNPLFDTMVSSSKVFSDEAVKIQETWKSTVEKQMEMCQDMLKASSGFFKQADK